MESLSHPTNNRCTRLCPVGAAEHEKQPAARLVMLNDRTDIEHQDPIADELPADEVTPIHQRRFLERVFAASRHDTLLDLWEPDAANTP